MSLPIQGPVISNPGGGSGGRGVPTESNGEHRLHSWTGVPPGWTFPLSQPCFPDGKTQAETNDLARTYGGPCLHSPTVPQLVREGWK